MLRLQWEMYRCRYPGSSFLGALASYDMTRKEVEAAEEKVRTAMIPSLEMPMPMTFFMKLETILGHSHGRLDDRLQCET